MGRLTHLIQGEPSPVYQLDFGDKVTTTVAEVVSAEAVRRLGPVIAELVAQVNAVGDSVESGAKSYEEASKDAQKAVEAAGSTLEASMTKQVEEIRKGIRRSITEARDASKSDMVGFRDTLVRALSNISIPDYTDQLAEMRGAILAALESDDDDDPREWEFTVNRNRNGYIQSVNAKAK